MYCVLYEKFNYKTLYFVNTKRVGMSFGVTINFGYEFLVANYNTVIHCSFYYCCMFIWIDNLLLGPDSSSHYQEFRLLTKHVVSTIVPIVNRQFVIYNVCENERRFVHI